MNTCRSSRPGADRCRLSFALLLGALLAIAHPAFAVIDLNSDGVGDIWALFHTAEAQSPTADPDGDGQTNAQESAAGTDPRSPNSIIRISSMSLDAAGLHLTFPTLIGKRYQVQSAANLSGTAWANVGSPLAGSGGDVTTIVSAAGAAQKFYRVLVQDVDSDGDGVTDWEELALGYDPNSSHSSGVNGADDFASITHALQAPNVITISAVEPAAAESGVKPGAFLITRSGNLNAITVRYTVSGGASPGTDYVALSGEVKLGVGVNSATVTVTPIADTVLESNEAVIVTLKTDAAYNLGSPATATVLISDDIVPNQAGKGGLFAQFWNEASSGATTPSATVAPSHPGTPVSRVDATINYDWPDNTTKGSGSPDAAINTNYFSSRWTGEVLPQYSQIYTFFFDVNLGGRVWVNGKLLINNWPGAPTTVASAEYSGTIELVGGVRYPIVVEQFETTGTSRARLSWQSANQAKQIIPQERLFANVPPQITSETEVLLLKGSGPYTYQIAASGNPTSFSAANLPPGWTFNSTTGVISGTPTQVGSWQVALTAVNTYGSGSAILELSVIDTGGAITREYWGSVNGTSVADIPVSTAPSTTGQVTSLEVPQNTDGNLGERLRGYLVAPATGAYQFSLTGDDSAELWVSNDDEPINSFRRAAVSAPGTGFQDWANAAKSELLWLEAGRRYYVEVLHKQSGGASHVSVGWIVPGSGATTPSVVPGFALSPYVAQAADEGDSILYTTSLTAQAGAVSGGYGSATLRMSADETQAILSFNYSNLTTPVTGKHVHSGAHGGAIIFDIDDASPRSDGSYIWDIAAAGAVSLEEVRQVIRNGDAYLNVHTSNYPAGEIKGFFRRQDASQAFVPPPPAPAWTDDHADPNAASRFLIQASFGPTPQEISRVQSIGYEAWIDDQFSKAATLHMDDVNANRNVTNPGGPTFSSNLTRNAWWKASITAPDQLRQRVAFALSEIMVVSTSGVLTDRANAISDFYDTLLTDAFGNFRTLMKEVTLHPAMGRYLDMLKNDRPDKTTGRIPNENYAREILQLFTVGLNRLHPDGSLMLNSKGQPVATYDQDVIIGFAHAFTGWDYNYTGTYRTTFGAASNWTEPMREVPARHFVGPKRILNNVVLPGMQKFNNQSLDPYTDPTKISGLTSDASFQALSGAELDATHDAIFNYPNVGPFICRQLIQRLVTSTPSRGYVYRVVQAFNGERNVHGVRTGVRGDMKEVIKAILLDHEARSGTMLTRQGYGKQREPVLRITALARAFQPSSTISGTYQQNGATITVTASAPHRLSTSNTIALNFTGTPPAGGGSFSVASVSGNTFTVRAKDAVNVSSYTQDNGTAGQPGTVIRVNTSNSHGLVTGDVITLDFLSGTPTAPADGPYQVTVVDTDTFTCTAADSASRSGGANSAVVTWLKGGYTQSSSSTTVTITSATPHGLVTGDEVSFTFKVDSGSALPNGISPVTVLDETQFTIVAPSAASRSGDVVAGINLPNVVTAKLTRSGNATAGLSTWRMDSTDTDLGQTPLDSPTVFNFFEPDYQYPGPLAQAGLVTPEFQLTSDTNVVRQTNLIYNGIFNPSSSTAIFSSFKSGGGAIGLDFTPWTDSSLAEPWLGTKPVPAEAWTSNANVGALIDRLNALLLAGQLPSTGVNNYTSNPRSIVNARQVILDFVTNSTNVTYTNTNPTEEQKRNRIRAIVHLLTSSPDFAIQK
ncbi:DUF1800 family protein [Verrucomicrobiota bacterium sgz303538]